MKKSIYRIHKYAGLTLGLFMFLLALSGVLITFRAELMPMIYPQFKVSPGTTQVPPEVMLRNSQDYLGEDRRITNLYSAEELDESYLILFKDEKKAFPGILTVNPYTGGVIGEMALWQNVFAVGLFFHANFFLGKIGENLVGLFGFVLVLFVLSGIYIWFPKSHLRHKARKLFSPERMNSQKIHHLLGLTLALPLLLSGLTGFLTIFDLSYPVLRLINQDSPRVEELSLKRACDFETDLKALSLATASQIENLISIHLCNKKNAYVKVTYGLTDRHFTGGYGRILIDPQSLKIVQSFDSSKDPGSWNFKRLVIYPLHSGEFFGFFGRLIVLISGIGLMIIFISGVLLSLRRKKQRAWSGGE